jgi:hypothetical protein
VDLVSTYHCLFGTGRFRVARSLKLADALYREIGSFEVKMTASGAETNGRLGAQGDGAEGQDFFTW